MQQCQCEPQHRFMPRVASSCPAGYASTMKRKRNMRISLKAMTLSSAVLWGGAMLFVGLIHLAVPAYGGDFLRIVSSVYPGADTAPKLGRVCLAQCMGSWMASSPVCSWVCSRALSTAVQEPFLGRWRLFGTLPIPGTLTGCVSTQRPFCRAQGQPSRC